MKDRKRADGTQFERDFQKFMSERLYVRRLPTLNTGFSGLRQPADFIVVGNTFSYVELKETAATAFSIRSMEQLDMMQDFVKDKVRYDCPGIKRMQYIVIVHYVTQKKFKVVLAEEALLWMQSGHRLHAEDEVGITVDSLEDLIRRVRF